jgi:hypothetical protein
MDFKKIKKSRQNILAIFRKWNFKLKKGCFYFILNINFLEKMPKYAK